MKNGNHPKPKQQESSFAKQGKAPQSKVLRSFGGYPVSF